MAKFDIFETDEKSLATITKSPNFSVFFILAPEREMPHFFLHYVVSKEIANLLSKGATVKVLILDNSIKLLDSEINEQHVIEFVNCLSTLIEMLGGNLSNVHFIFESSVIDEKQMTNNVLKLVSSLSMNEIFRASGKINYSLSSGLFDAAAIISLPRSEVVNFVVIGEHEKTAAYIFLKKTKLLSKRKVNILYTPAIYTMRNDEIFPYGIGDRKLFISDATNMLEDDISTATAADVKTAIKPFLMNFIDDGLAKEYLSKKKYFAWKNLRNCNTAKIKEIFIGYVTNFSKRFEDIIASKSDTMRIVKLTSPNACDLFSALSNNLRLDILAELRQKGLTLSEILSAISKKPGKKNLTAAHIFHHLKILEESGLIKKEDRKYFATFSNVDLLIR